MFPIANASLGARKTLLDATQRDLKTPELAPPRARHSLQSSGLVVVGIALIEALQANGSEMTLLALALAALWLLVYHRPSPRPS